MDTKNVVCITHEDNPPIFKIEVFKHEKKTWEDIIKFAKEEIRKM